MVLVSGGQDYLYDTMRSGNDVSFWRLVRWPGFFWYLWALLTPIVFFAAHRYRLDGGFAWGRLAKLGLACCAVVLAHIVLQVAAMELPFYQHLHPDLADAVSFHFFSSIHTNVITVILLVGAWYAGTHYHSLRRREVQQASLESQLTRAELEALKMQIQPHFLFNTLNGISELMHRDVPSAERMLSHLSHLLRTSIYRSGDPFVPLEDEVAFVQHYLEIEQVRFEDRLDVRFEIDDAARDALVPSMILQPFAENAVKHGAAPLSRPVVVRIRAIAEGDRLVLEVADDGAGLSSTNGVEGVGIENVRRRLDYLFGADYELWLGAERQGFTVRLSLPLRMNEQPAAAL